MSSRLNLKNDYTTFLMRIALLYCIFGLCRVLFFIFNNSLIDPITGSEISGIIKGSFIFDSVSIFYINIPFILLSLIPFKFRERGGYQQFLFLFFIVTNSVAIYLNCSDIFYYEFKLGRIASDDIHYFGQDNAGNIFISLLKDYWYGFLIYFAIIFLLIIGYKKIPYYPTTTKRRATYYVSSSILLPVTIGVAIIMIRGGNISGATYPIAMSDATLYVKNTTHSSLILSNPFCLIRTMNSRVKYEKYFDDKELNSIFTPTEKIDTTIEREFKIDSSTNIMLILLESFGSAHLKPLNGKDHSYTPFLDSLASQGMLMTNAYHNGIRSIDALPAIWGSIPTFKTQFLSLPQSVAPMQTLPSILKKMGYTTAFMHGAVRKSMSFVAFAHTSDVDITYSQEEYEQERGTADFDGTWGIWDDKFIDFTADKIIELQKPFFATLFTLSSHSPFALPDQFKDKFKGGTLPIHKTMEYTDAALKEFFNKLSKEPFYDNTLFILTADHSSASDIEKFQKVPYSYSVPIIFYKPNSNIKGTFPHVSSHIDIMPTLLGMIDYKKPYFGFGTDLFGSTSHAERFTINYFGGAFNIVTDSTTYQFNEKEIISIISEKPTQDSIPPHIYNKAKAIIQQYYQHIESRNYIPNETSR